MQPEGVVPGYFIFMTYVLAIDTYADAAREIYGTPKAGSKSRYCTMKAGHGLRGPLDPADQDRVDPSDPAIGNVEAWNSVPELFRDSGQPLPQPWEDRFGPLRRA